MKLSEAHHQSCFFPFFLFIFFIIILISLNASPNDFNTNKAVKINVKSSSFHSELEGQSASLQKTFFILTTQWENIHPKKKIEKEKLEKKKDITMGVKLLIEKNKSEQEYVYVDVAYMVKKLSDHVYCLADGLAYSLHPLTELIKGGVCLSEPFTLHKKGDVREACFVFSLPEDVQNLAFQFFDYEYGNILIPVQGNAKDARGDEGSPERIIGAIKDKKVEIAAHSVTFLNEYLEEQAPEGWRFAKVHISGKSLSGESIKNIVQIEPEEYIWLTADRGYLYYAIGGTTTEEGFLRFTPEVYQSQEVFFLVPNVSQIDSLGIRIQNSVYDLALVPENKRILPNPAASHQDGDTMKVLVFSAEQKDSFIILDLGIQSLVSSGIEIMRDQQFILVHKEQKIFMNDDFTDSLLHCPPSPFIIPSETFVRFKLAYKSDFLPSVLYFRGFESEKNIDISILKK